MVCLTISKSGPAVNGSVRISEGPTAAAYPRNAREVSVFQEEAIPLVLVNKGFHADLVSASWSVRPYTRREPRYQVQMVERLNSVEGSGLAVTVSSED